jgi:hypothetical protein
MIRFRNGRELAARDYWRAGDWLMFSQPRGAVGVPDAFIAAIVALPPAAKIGGSNAPVNARALSVRGRSVTLPP